MEGCTEKVFFPHCCQTILHRITEIGIREKTPFPKGSFPCDTEYIILSDGYIIPFYHEIVNTIFLFSGTRIVPRLAFLFFSSFSFFSPEKEELKKS